MAGNTLGRLFAVTTFGESHGPAIGCVIDGCPPGMALDVGDIQPDLDRRRPGTSRHVTQRQEADAVEILSGVFEGVTTGTPIALLIRNQDARSRDYGNLADTFRPGHADYSYFQKYGLRDHRGGGRSSARLAAPLGAGGAAALAPDAALASIISTILVIAGKQEMGTGIALAIPLAAAGQVLTILVRTITVGFQHAAVGAMVRSSYHADMQAEEASRHASAKAN